MIIVKLPLAPRHQLEEEYKRRYETYSSLLDRLWRDIKDQLDDTEIRATIKFRVKHFRSWYTKVLARVDHESESIRITDVLGIRVVCPFLQDMTRVTTLLQRHYEVEEIDHKGSDFSYQYFGYQSIHLLIRLPSSEGLENEYPVCEIQVRTILQEAWAEVEHELVYKSDFTPLDEPLKRKLAALNANLTLSDIMFQEIRDYQAQLHQALHKRRQDFYSQVRKVTEVRPGTDEDRESSNRLKAGDTEAAGSPSPDTIDSLLLKGLTAHNENRLDEAIAIYSRILNLEPDDRIASIILVHRGMAYFSRGEYDHAAEDFSGALGLDPNNVKARYHRALVHRVKGRVETALSDIGYCLTKDPYNLEFLLSRAEIFFDAGRYSEARNDCRGIMQLEPDFAPVQRLWKKLEERQ